MNLRLILVLLILASLFFETAILALPFLFIVSILSFMLFPDLKTLILVFIVGILLDILKVNTVGLTPVITFVSFIILVFIKRVFEVRDFRINLLILFFSSFVFANFASYSDNLLIYFLIFGSIWFSLSYFLKTRLLW